tara:strand:+ start:92 stop:622 length:531 start_codon:yes stop_codon:yes gene_type:complete
MKLVVLCSGSGSNFENIVRSCWKHEVVGMIYNIKDCYARTRAAKFGIPSCYIPHKDEDTMIDCINMVKPDLIVLAGYMRVLSSKFISSVTKMINIHPSLLPKYKGLHAIEQALLSGDNVSGVTVHYVTPELDSGDIILQKQVEILQDDTLESLTKRIQRMEHCIMPLAIDKALGVS